MVMTGFRRVFGIAGFLTLGSTSTGLATAGFVNPSLPPDWTSRTGEILIASARVSTVTEMPHPVRSIISRALTVKWRDRRDGEPSAANLDVSTLPGNPSLVVPLEPEGKLLDFEQDDWRQIVKAGDEVCDWLPVDALTGQLARRMARNSRSRVGMSLPGAEPERGTRPTDEVGTPPSVVLLAFGLIFAGILSVGTRPIRRLIRAINRGPGRRTVYRYFY